jgi:hypothetical protein
MHDTQLIELSVLFSVLSSDNVRGCAIHRLVAQLPAILAPQWTISREMEADLLAVSACDPERQRSGQRRRLGRRRGLRQRRRLGRRQRGRSAMGAAEEGSGEFAEFGRALCCGLLGLDGTVYGSEGQRFVSVGELHLRCAGAGRLGR